MGMEKLIYSILSVEFTLSAVDSPLFQLSILHLKLNSKSELLKFLFSLVTDLVGQHCSFASQSVYSNKNTQESKASRVCCFKQGDH